MTTGLARIAPAAATPAGVTPAGTWFGMTGGTASGATA